MAYNAEYHRQYYLNNPEKYKYNPARREYNKMAAARWRKENREAAMLSGAKSRAKRFGLEFDIEVADIIIPEFCPILNIPLQFTDTRAGPGTPALDRVDNSKGYVKGNIRVISQKANMNKGDLSIEDITRLYNYVNERKNSA